MRNLFDGRTLLRVGRVVGALVLAAGMQGRQSQGQQDLKGGPAPPGQTQVQPQALEIYRIELEPTGTAFALSKPQLEGDVYVFTVWPERDTVRLKKARVKKISRLTSDVNKESVYWIDLVPTGKMLSREEPKLKTGNYIFHDYKNGALMSLRQADVKKITHLTGLPAFKVKQQALGVALIDNLPMGSGSVVVPAPAAAAAPPGQAPPPGNWIYEGHPGATDAYAPANATVASPGDVPKAPAPVPTPH
jgi:hypothetical protein